MMTNLIQLARVYDVHAPFPPNTFLTDRLWPRGISKERLSGAEWLKNVAPSDTLRRAFHAGMDSWAQFIARYRAELDANEAAWRGLLDILRSGGSITLLYGSKDTRHNQAVVLRDYLTEKLAAKR